MSRVFLGLRALKTTLTLSVTGLAAIHAHAYYYYAIIALAVAVFLLSQLAVAVVVTTSGVDLPSPAQMVTRSCHYTEPVISWVAAPLSHRNPFYSRRYIRIDISRSPYTNETPAQYQQNGSLDAPCSC